MARTPHKYKIELSDKEKQELKQATRKGQQDARVVIRILIILLADQGRTIAETATYLVCTEQTVLNWRKRFLERRSAGAVAALMDLPRSGRPPLYGAKERSQVKAVVCQTLRERQLPLSRFSVADLHRVVVKEDGLSGLSQGTLRRFLRDDALKPWQYRYWLFPRDPNFINAACVVLDLYAGFWEGQRLGSDEYRLSADEKRIQVLARCHPSLPAILGSEQRVEFEYKRLGTVAYLAAWDISRARIYGLVAPTASIETFGQLVTLVMEQAPYRTAARAFWLVDSGPAHHRSTFPQRLAGMYSNAVAVMLPVHASWLNQIEIYFSIVQRKVLTPLDVTDEAAVKDRLMRFQDYYQEVAKPFSWKFTADDLKKRLDAIKEFSVALP